MESAAWALVAHLVCHDLSLASADAALEQVWYVTRTQMMRYNPISDQVSTDVRHLTVYLPIAELFLYAKFFQ